MAKEYTQDEKERFKHNLELSTTIVIALATIASAWCAYQATLWSGIQMFRLSAVNALGRKSSEQTVRAGQMRSMDGILFIEYLKGKERHEDFLADFFYHRFRPELKRATDAWLATKPFQNPQSPLHPLVMEEYSLEPEQEAKRLSEETAQKFEEAREANQNSDNYIMLTVLFASVMFFGGISTQFESPRCRITLLAIGALVLCTALGVLITYPIALE
ncbi:MAG: hypothetical protein DYG83_00080 [Candidatus Brocadia sp. AMX2]|uniref:DUF4337 domain-containing protein n=1 Tax=Candidatus Brocadia sinica JPN1 TaxID=1197129 RepID=A0ABQ0JWB7_9BACT|nr:MULTISPECIES: hypothetical protein [Brocadia]MBC6931751.1 hypothetical protein [Candidatus Brocadia sp.]MBL1167393.1 hypothetical protein [Candidatus Brocadia sp. AMX1]MCK6466734.1 hypothetical protein [Candidatus Brocadia sinica]NOG41134.1 hypothetical protein [Planctomycetota bacterium]KAA0245793.1 MAG: hypothetical protein EDM70_02660 [Candidatus Brocadia sp. AMX2]